MSPFFFGHWNLVIGIILVIVIWYCIEVRYAQKN